MTSPTFGIDLGTTCSAIGWVKDGVPTLLKIDGHELLPSVVSWSGPNPPLVGQAALNQLAVAPEHTIRSAKRQMGGDRVWSMGDRSITPIDVGAAVLRRLAKAATDACGHAVERVVITVPAWFTQAQRADTRRAGELAGLEVVRLINEPTAAALAHAHGQPMQRRALVYDFGGGTFDVSVVVQDGPVVEVLASHGDDRLGGDDIDDALVQHVLGRVRSSSPQTAEAIAQSLAAMSKVRSAVEQAKITLSSTISTVIRAPYLIEVADEPYHLELELHRDTLDELAAPFIERTLTSVHQVLRDADLSPSDIDDLLLVGGSSLLPTVYNRLHAETGLEASAAIPATRAVALGAAIQAAIVDGSRVDGILIDVAPFALSAAVVSNPFGTDHPTHIIARVITPRNAPLPARHTEVFYTSDRYQERVYIPIMQGSNINPLRNAALGSIGIGDLPPAQGDGTRPISVEFRHNLDGMVTVTICDVLTGRSVEGQVVADADEAADAREQLQGYCEGYMLIDTPESDAGPSNHASLDTADDTDDAPQDDLKATFTKVLDTRELLSSEYGDKATPLFAVAQRGLTSLKQDDTAAAHELHEELADLMFEQGIYL